jgi:hypothetical protein
MITFGVFSYKNQLLTVRCGRYGIEPGDTAPRIAILIDCEEGPYCKLSVNLSYCDPFAGGKLQFGEFVVAHNAPPALLEALLTAKYPWFEDTGRRVSYGFVTGSPVLRLTPGTLAEFTQDLLRLYATL